MPSYTSTRKRTTRCRSDLATERSARAQQTGTLSGSGTGIGRRVSRPAGLNTKPSAADWGGGRMAFRTRVRLRRRAIPSPAARSDPQLARRTAHLVLTRQSRGRRWGHGAPIRFPLITGRPSRCARIAVAAAHSCSIGSQELGDEPYLVRSPEFDYDDFDYALPVRRSRTSSGHPGQHAFRFLHPRDHSIRLRPRRRAPGLVNTGNELYSRLSESRCRRSNSNTAGDRATRTCERARPEGIENLPNRTRRRGRTNWVDLDGEGIPES